MYLARAVALVFILLTGATAFEAVAQRTQRTPPQVAREAPPPVFRARAPQARLQTLRSLGGDDVEPSQLMTPFSLTPQFPYAEGRGAMSSNGASWLPMFNGPTGVVRATETSDNAMVHLVGPPRRYLIDCAVSPGITIRARSGSWQAQATAASAQGPQLVSFYTTVLGNNPNVSLTDAAPNVTHTPQFMDKFGVIHPATDHYSGWRLSGCEITPIAAN